MDWVEWAVPLWAGAGLILLVVGTVQLVRALKEKDTHDESK